MANKPLTEKEVIQMKTLLIAGLSVRKVARATGRSERTVERVKFGVSHRDVEVAGEELLRPADIQLPKEASSEEIEACLQRILAAQGGLR